MSHAYTPARVHFADQLFGSLAIDRISNRIGQRKIRARS
jgi:hypothetical protein